MENKKQPKSNQELTQKQPKKSIEQMAKEMGLSFKYCKNKLKKTGTIKRYNEFLSENKAEQKSLALNSENAKKLVALGMEENRALSIVVSNDEEIQKLIEQSLIEKMKAKIHLDQGIQKLEITSEIDIKSGFDLAAIRKALE